METAFEVYAEHGAVRCTQVAEAIQVTLVGQKTPPRLTPDGIVFELPVLTSGASSRRSVIAVRRSAPSVSAERIKCETRPARAIRSLHMWVM